MARVSYGPEVRRRSHQLLGALLDYGNDELDCDERALETLRSQIQAHWQTDQRLVIRTKLRYLVALTTLAAVPLSGPQIKEALGRWQDFLGLLEDNRPHRSGSEVWHFTLRLWHPRRDRAANLRRFELEWEQRRAQRTGQGAAVSPKEVSECLSPPSTAALDWWQLCRDSLETQQLRRLSTNPLTMSDGLAFDVDDLYVPLGLLRRQHQPRWDDDAGTRRGLPLTELEESEAVQPVAIADFLAQLGAASKPQRIAIVGEPGAGKTTLLQRVALWLLERRSLPIWVSLADLQGVSLETYVLQEWLRQATRCFQVDPAHQADLVAQGRSGRLWLLLDAVDEMALDGGAALGAIARQLRGWMADVHIVLTCRLNVWDSGHNPLDTFETYCNGPLSDALTSRENLRAQVITQWFQAQPDLGKQLQAELDKPERWRIKAAVKNPLRLALLCRSWSLLRGNLPSTQASLYHQFVEALYAWKQDRFPTNLVQRHQLNQALGRLALAALRQPDLRFRLPSAFLEQVLAEDLVLLPLALQLGWLNQVGVSATSGEKIYAFYHPTFQEYFAAQAIADWRDFFRPCPELPIFNPAWREVILLWMGRPEGAIADKEAFLTALLQFEDGCGGFYGGRAQLLAAAALAEFPQASQARALLDQILEWRFSYQVVADQRQPYPAPVVEGARIALRYTDRALAIAALEDFLASTDNLFARWNAACTLGKILDPGNPQAIATLEQLCTSLRNEPLRLQVADSLGKIDPGNATAQATLRQLLGSPQARLRRRAAYCLGKLMPDHPEAIATLEKLLTASDRALAHQAAKSLQALVPEHPQAQAMVSPQPKSFPGDRPPGRNRRSRQMSVEAAQQRKLQALEARLTMASELRQRQRVAFSLCRLQPGHPAAVQTLLDLLRSPLPAPLTKRIVEVLRSTLTPEQMASAIQVLRPWFPESDAFLQPGAAGDRYKLLWHCAQNLTHADFQQAWNSTPARFK